MQWHERSISLLELANAACVRAQLNRTSSQIQKSVNFRTAMHAIWRAGHPGPTPAIWSPHRHVNDDQASVFVVKTAYRLDRAFDDPQLITR